MRYYVKMGLITVECNIIAVDWSEQVATVKIENETHTVSLYKLVMQTSLFERTPFADVKEAISGEF